ncbi:VOC family protein [Sphingobacterium tabacisoli]|uniref:VOC family protein n=1 Tax=Sphingobacterium tabacisoli TaxID=2044855 RepID=A0ABW5L215_9SPHI|nr:VOC family protein [Sphingobacterium tabacisoli]
MKVKRIVVNMATTEIDRAKVFYQDILNLQTLMDMNWIHTYGNDEQMQVQISFMSEGGAGTPVPDISIEVDDIDYVYQKMIKSGFIVLYGPINESWGVRRFFVKDPFDKIINILSHIE